MFAKSYLKFLRSGQAAILGTTEIGNKRELLIYLCLNAAKRNETKDKWFLEFPSAGAFVGSVF